eukprot:TRINITY_DN41116_c0_g1_i6.p1 TRINITY_DN41116_c0_g1~~TRINITY_DN41116_c0_g1_i6.p1  ORF type:complete len:307 (+),score=38.13 TRINITY_DN41116_c0_g1_i6:99-1019(+)
MQAVKLGVAYVDVEYKALDNFKILLNNENEILQNARFGTQLIVSYHDFKSTPSKNEVQDLLIQIAQNPLCDIVKAAFMANDISDALMLLQTLRELRETGKFKKPVLLLSMGERGQIARVLAGKYGGYLTFGAMQQGQQSAPGQPTVQQLKELYRVQQQTPNTKVYGIVANPVSHSKSPLIHNASFSQVGVDSVYVPMLVDDMDTFIASFSDPEFAGFSVSIPHKQDALRLADKVDPIAEQIGAVNTLIRQEDGTLKGYNTDWSGAITAIEEGMESAFGSRDLKGKTVVVIGAGGYQVLPVYGVGLG